MDSHLAFSLARTAIADRILIPKYYDPDLKSASDRAGREYDLRTLRSLLLAGDRGSRLGTWIRRDFYGSGDIPYVRTSDLAHWRIRPDFKKGVSEDVYDDVAERQDVWPGDILMVAHGTYLIGNVALVTEADSRIVLQDHVFRLRVDFEQGLDSHLVLALLSTAFVRRQVRARQFSADIIDKLGNRHLDVLLAVPRERELRDSIGARVRSVVEEQSRIRAELDAIGRLDARMSRERAESRYRFPIRRSQIRRRILIPKYYDPVLEADLVDAEAGPEGPWVTIAELVRDGVLAIGAGVEVGKMAYGTGDIPFVRTTDLVEMEVKRDIRHSVSEGIYNRFADKAGLAEGDVILVRDGTYLVGSSALVGASDLPALFCGGIYRLHCRKAADLEPAGLLATLNLSLVRRQMRARQFTRDVIDTLGKRIFEVRVPRPGSPLVASLQDQMKGIVRRKAAMKEEIGAIIAAVEPPAPPAIAGRPGWSMR